MQASVLRPKLLKHSRSARTPSSSTRRSQPRAIRSRSRTRSVSPSRPDVVRTWLGSQPWETHALRRRSPASSMIDLALLDELSAWCPTDADIDRAFDAKDLVD